MTYTVSHSGTPRARPYDYKCTCCDHKEVIKHTMMDDTKHICCRCGEPTIRYITKAPSLGADHHESMRFHNLGWESEDGR